MVMVYTKTHSLNRRTLANGAYAPLSSQLNSIYSRVNAVVSTQMATPFLLGVNVGHHGSGGAVSRVASRLVGVPDRVLGGHRQGSRRAIGAIVDCHRYSANPLSRDGTEGCSREVSAGYIDAWLD